jgi:hypothetical protein
MWPGSSFWYGCSHRRTAAPLTRNLQAAKTDSYDVASASARTLFPVYPPSSNHVSHWPVEKHAPLVEQPYSIHYQRGPPSSHVPFVILWLPDTNRSLHFRPPPHINEVTSGGQSSWGTQRFCKTLTILSDQHEHFDRVSVPRLREGEDVPSAAGRDMKRSVWRGSARRTHDKVRLSLARPLPNTINVISDPSPPRPRETPSNVTARSGGGAFLRLTLTDRNAALHLCFCYVSCRSGTPKVHIRKASRRSTFLKG